MRTGRITMLVVWLAALQMVPVLAGAEFPLKEGDIWAITGVCTSMPSR